MKQIQSYVRAQSLEQAYQLNQNRRSRILGGMLWLKQGQDPIGTAIDLCELGLDTIEEDEQQFSIGAMVTLRRLEQHAGLEKCFHGAVRQAVQDIVGVQFRNMATIGGSLWGRFGFSDVLTVLLALDASVELYHAGIVSLEQFAAMPYDRDLLVRVLLKKAPVQAAYQAVRIQRTDFPVLNCAVARQPEGWRAVIGARPGKAVIVRDVQGLLAQGVTEAGAAAFADAVAQTVPTGSNSRGSAEYRTHLARVLTARAVLRAAEQKGE